MTATPLQPNYLIGCIHLSTDSVHSCPLLQAPSFLLLCSVGLPLDTGNKEDMRRGICPDGSAHGEGMDEEGKSVRQKD